MFNNLNILFLFLTMTSSLISVSSTSWLGAWMGLELNMLSFIPLINSKSNILSNESALKYFLIQAIASCSFLTFCLLNTFYCASLSNMNFTLMTNLLMILPLIMKLGAAPFQSWFIMVMEGLTWLKCLILMTWQKLAPLFIMFYISSNKILVPFCVLSLLVGSIGGLNQTSVKKIMAYSSINHLGWLITSLLLNKYFLMFYFITYFFLNLFTIMNFIKHNLTNFNQFFFKNHIHLSLNLLSLSGLPPLLGFLPKWLILLNLINMKMFFLTIFVILTALITTFFYIRLILKSLLMSNYTQKWTSTLNFKTSVFDNIILMTTCLGLFLFNLIT